MIHQAITRCIPALTVISFMTLFPASMHSVAAGQTKTAGNTNAAPSQRRPLPEPADPKLLTLFLIGDSTVRNGQGDGANGQWGWGELIVAFFDTTTAAQSTTIHAPAARSRERGMRLRRSTTYSRSSMKWFTAMVDLRKFVADTKARGATSIVCSPIPRKIWKDGKIASIVVSTPQSSAA